MAAFCRTRACADSLRCSVGAGACRGLELADAAVARRGYVFSSIEVVTDPARIGLNRSEDALNWIFESATHQPGRSLVGRLRM